MATNKLADSMANGMQSYISGLPIPKEDNYNFQNGYRSIFNNTEDYWNKIIEIDNDYTIPENEGNLTIIIKSTGVTADPTIELPLLSTNIGRRLFFINENAGHRIVIRPKFSSSDTIEGFSVMDIMQSTHKNRIELIATSYGWKRKAKEFIIIPENLRPNGWVLNAGTSTVWSDVSFLSWVQEGAYALLLRYTVVFIGNDADDNSVFLLRPKGSIIDNPYRNTAVGFEFSNLITGTRTSHSGQIIVNCDNNSIIQYRKLNPIYDSNFLYLQIDGYFK